MKHLSLRIRLTLMTMALLFCSCILLTVIVNFQARGMAEQIWTDSSSLSQAQPLPPRASDKEPSIIPARPLIPSRLETPFRIFTLGSFFAMAAIVAAGGFLAYLLSGYALRPVRDIARQIRRVDADSLLAPILLPDTKDELAVIVQAFNETTDKLFKAFAVQKQFSANAAHELRTPLAVLQTQIDVFRKKKTPAVAEQAQLIAVIERSIKRLSGIVGDLLTLTQTGTIENPEAIGLLSLAQDVAESLEPVWQAKQMQVVMSGSDVPIFGSYHLLYRALYNLVENAVNYGAAKSEVRITVSKQKTAAFVRISNTGPVILPEFRERIFEPFFRADPSRSKATGGVGLGLAIAQNILCRHDGSLSLAEAGPEETCFVMELRLGAGC